MDKLKYEHKHCTNCGQSLTSRVIKPNEPERLVCDGCGFVQYLDPKLAACAIIEDGGRVALLRRAIQPAWGKWVVPGGFVDRGEPVHLAMVREVEEETGLIVKPAGLVGLYSYPNETTAVAVYRTVLMEGRLVALDESLEARWFALDDIPWDELAFQSTQDSLSDYLSRGCDG